MISLDKNYLRRSQKSDIIFGLENIFKNLKIRYSFLFLKKLTEAHHNYPSLQSISDTLDVYHIKNEAFEFEQKHEISGFPEPHLSYIVNDGTHAKMFVFVHEIGEGSIKYQIPASNKAILIEEPLSTYFKKWTGIALFFSKTAVSREPGYLKNRIVAAINYFKIPLTILLFLALSAVVHVSVGGYNNSYLLFGLEALKLTGFVFSALMVSYTYDKNNPLIKGICALGEKADCNAILSSDAAKAFGLVNWSEIGLLYFSGTYLITIIAGLSTHASLYSCLLIFTLLSLPYTFYSIYYQLVVARKICLLCTSVQVILWLEFFALLSADVPFTGIEGFSWVLSALALVSLSFIWFLIKPLIADSFNLPGVKKELKKFKLNPFLFKTALLASRNLPYPKELGVVFFGDRKSPIQLTIFTNPMCGPCGVIHKKADQLLHDYPGKIGLTLIFTVSDFSDNRSKAAAAMLELYQQKGSAEALELIGKWFSRSNKDAGEWMKELQLSGDLENVHSELLRQYAGLVATLPISVTPTIAVNGYQMPEDYSFDDFMELVPYLV